MSYQDFYTDNSLKILHKLLKNDSSLAPLVKTAAEEISKENPDCLPPTSFADEVNLRFPIHTPELAKLSFCYAKEQKAPAELLQKIAEAIELYGFEIPEIDHYNKVSSSSRYLFPEEEYYPVNNKHEIKLAGIYFDDYGHQLPVPKRREYCINLVKAAAEEGYPHTMLPKYVLRYAGITGTDLQKLAVELENRLYICKEQSKPEFITEAYIKLAEELSDFEGPEVYDHPQDFEKIASAVAEIDKEAGVASFYGNSINDAFTAVFNIDKLAEETINIDGMSVPCSKLCALSKMDFKDALGDEFAQEVFDNNELNVQKLKAILPTLPLDMKRELKAYVRNV
jgi:hypothetical protein